MMNTPWKNVFSTSKSRERYYLRVLLLYVKGAKSYEDVRTVKEQLCETFHAACLRPGLLADGKK